MSDLISRKAILRNIEKIRQSLQMMDDTHRADIVMSGIYLCEEAVRKQPSEQKIGHWIGIDDEPYEVYECDRCGTTYDTVGNTWDIPYFCPNCGADMRGEADETD